MHMDMDVFAGAGRLRWAIDWREAARRRRPGLEDAVLDAAYDKLVDLLLERDDVGATRAAVFALGNKQLGWRRSDALRLRRLPSGERRPGPAGAVSLDRLRAPLEDGRVLREPASRDDVELTAIRRLSFRKVVAEARRDDPVTAAIVVGYAVGLGPEELAAQTGLKANTVTQRKGRFERSHREDAA
jgi:hypothetical protein